MEARRGVGQHRGEQIQGGGSDFKVQRARLSSFLPTDASLIVSEKSGQLCSFFFHYHVHLFPVIAVPNEPQIQCLAAAAAKSLQSCPTLCDPRDGSPPGSSGILQARTLEWVAISFSTASKGKVKVKSLSRV